MVLLLSFIRDNVSTTDYITFFTKYQDTAVTTLYLIHDRCRRKFWGLNKINCHIISYHRDILFVSITSFYGIVLGETHESFIRFLAIYRGTYI